MKVTPAAIAIALLLASNIATGYLALHRDEIRADHLQRIQLNTEGDGTVFVTLGRSDTPGGPVVNNPYHAATLELTPRAAIQLQSELTQTIRLIHQAAQAQRAEARSQQRVD